MTDSTAYLTMLVVMTGAFLVMAVLAGVRGDKQEKYHTAWCEIRMDSVSTVDTLAVLLDDGFCRKVIEP